MPKSKIMIVFVNLYTNSSASIFSHKFEKLGIKILEGILCPFFIVNLEWSKMPLKRWLESAKRKENKSLGEITRDEALELRRNLDSCPLGNLTQALKDKRLETTQLVNFKEIQTK